MRKFKTIWISDVHLGGYCQTDALLSFLKNYESDILFLVGDIVDFWAMKRSVRWTTAENTVLQKILRKARQGTRIIYIPGNHDEIMDSYFNHIFGNIEIYENYIYTSLSGLRLLILHGDEYDVITRYYKFIAVMGDMAYCALMKFNYYFNLARKHLNLGYWSLSAFLKHHVKQTVNFIGGFEEGVIKDVEQHNVDGVVCGHIHHPVIRRIGNSVYMNSGDWVESCSGIAEDYDGTFYSFVFNKETSNIDIKETFI